MRTSAALAAAIGATSIPAAATELAPGMWEIALEMRVPAQPGFAPEPLRLRQCLTLADAKDPSALLGGLANPGASGCSYRDKTYSGNTFRFTMECAGSFAIRSEGMVTFSSDSMNGTVNAVADVGGTRTETSSRIFARRLGGC